MTGNEPDAEGWRLLFAPLPGDAVVDANIVRAFWNTHRVTPAGVMTEMHAQRRIDPEETPENQRPDAAHKPDRHPGRVQLPLSSAY